MTRPFATLRALLALVFLAAALGGCAKAPVSMTNTLPGELFAPGESGPESVDLATAARGVDYVLIGEGHTAACDHRVQADAVAALAQADLDPVLGLEMVPVDKQPVLDRFNAGEFGVDALEAELEWEDVWGYDFSLYEPIFREAAENRVPLIALNVPKRVVRAVSAHGLDGVPEEDRDMLPLTVVPPTRDQVSSLAREFQRHKGMMSERRIRDEQARFLLIQSLWDTAMAGNAVRAHKRMGGVMLILAGGGHVEYDWGIAHRIALMQPGARVLSAMPWRGLDELDPTAADLFFYCTLTHSLRLGFTLEQFPDYAEVAAVAPGTKADKAGFKAGDRIETVQGMVAEDLWVLHKAAVQARRDRQPLEFTVLRGDERLTLSVPLTMPEDEPGSEPADKAD